MNVLIPTCLLYIPLITSGLFFLSFGFFTLGHERASESVLLATYLVDATDVMVVMTAAFAHVSLTLIEFGARVLL